MSNNEGAWLYVSTPEVRDKIPRDAYMVGADRPWIECLPRFGPDGYLVIPELPFYAWHPTFSHWNEREIYRLSGADT